MNFNSDIKITYLFVESVLDAPVKKNSREKKFYVLLVYSLNVTFNGNPSCPEAKRKAIFDHVIAEFKFLAGKGYLSMSEYFGNISAPPFLCQYIAHA